MVPIPADGTAMIPLAGRFFSILLSMVTISVLAACITRRLQAVRSWQRLPFTGWLLIFIYCDSSLFVLVTAILSQAVGLNTSAGVCDGAILLCLICYVTTKWAIYVFLVEKVYIIRGGMKPRRKDKLYLFNFFLFICPYMIIIILSFVFRIAYIDSSGVCVIGMQKVSMIPLIGFDIVINLYLTILFIIPLRKLYSYKHKINTALRTMAMRTFVGACAALTSSVVNLTILMVLKGEPGWICLMCCNADILFCVLVLHWVTAIDSKLPAKKTTSGCSRCPARPQYHPIQLDTARSWPPSRKPSGDCNPHSHDSTRLAIVDEEAVDTNMSFITSALYPLAATTASEPMTLTQCSGGAETHGSDTGKETIPPNTIEVHTERIICELEAGAEDWDLPPSSPKSPTSKPSWSEFGT